MSNIVSTIIEIVIIVAGFLCIKFIPSVNQGMTKNENNVNTITAALDCVSKAAYSFVVWAKNKMTKQTGNEKFDFVVKQVIKFCEDKNIELTEEQIKAIVESSYEKMVQQVITFANRTETKESED